MNQSTNGTTQPVYEETEELIAIIAKSILTAKKNNNLSILIQV